MREICLQYQTNPEKGDIVVEVGLCSDVVRKNEEYTLGDRFIFQTDESISGLINRLKQNILEKTDYGPDFYALKSFSFSPDEGDSKERRQIDEENKKRHCSIYSVYTDFVLSLIKEC